jgi:hypothetical protein
MSEENEPARSDEIEITEGDASRYSDQDVLEKTIEIIEQERDDIRTIIQSSLSVSGLLLTISLGALYFSYSRDSIVEAPSNMKEALFISAFCLTISIFVNILALRMKPIRPIETEDRAILLRDSYLSEKRYTKWSTIALLISILLLFYGMGAFAWNQVDIDSQYIIIKDDAANQIQCMIKEIHSAQGILSNISAISGFESLQKPAYLKKEKQIGKDINAS